MQRFQLPAGPMVWLVTRYEEARRALADPRLAKDPRRLSDPQRQGFGGRRCPDDVWAVVGRHAVNSDGVDHQRFQSVYGPFLGARAVGRWRALIEEITTEQLNLLATAKAPDLLEEFARPVPARVITHILGLPDEQASAVARCTRQWVSAQPPAVTAAVVQEMEQMISQSIREHRASPQDDLLNAMLARQAAGEWSLREVVGVAFSTLVAGSTTAPTLVATATGAAAGNQRLRKSLTTVDATQRLVEEALRYQPPAGNATWRFALEELVLGEVTIPQGSIVLVSISAANRDPDVYPQAAELCPAREARPPHLTFGHGPHYCTGAPLARLEAEIMLPALFARFPRLSLIVPLEEVGWQMSVIEQHPLTMPVHLDEEGTR
ncbi:cytochrome P450 [Streptomyces sp. NPDC055239]